MNQYLAFELTPGARTGLLERFTPSFKRVLCQHVTVEFNLDEQKAQKLQEEFQGAALQVVGHRCGDGVECLVVSVNGSPRRPDGRIYHITLSLSEGHKPVESNVLIQQHGYQSCVPIGFDAELKLLNK